MARSYENRSRYDELRDQYDQLGVQLWSLRLSTARFAALLPPNQSTQDPAAREELKRLYTEFERERQHVARERHQIGLLMARALAREREVDEDMAQGATFVQRWRNT